MSKDDSADILGTKYSPILREPEQKSISFYEETEVVTAACNPGRGFEEDIVIEVAPVLELTEKEKKRNEMIILQLRLGLISFALTMIGIIVFVLYFT